jgi:hypothetical protein
MRTAFQAADPSIEDDNFLSVFQSRGCYLTDLTGEPVDNLDRELRQTMRRAGEKVLACEIAELRPERIAPVLRSIVDNVARAAAQAKWEGEILELPYPGRWIRHREAFIEALVPVIRGLSPRSR